MKTSRTRGVLAAMGVIGLVTVTPLAGPRERAYANLSCAPECETVTEKLTTSLTKHCERQSIACLKHAVTQDDVVACQDQAATCLSNAELLAMTFNDVCCAPISPSTIFVARKVITMNALQPFATAVLVRDGRVVAMGSEQSLQLLAGRTAQVDRTFQNMVLLPGFVDPHQHPIFGGRALIFPTVSFYDAPNPYGSPTMGLKTKGDVLNEIKQLDAQLSDPTQLLMVWGYDPLAQGGPSASLLTIQDLDPISRTRPIIVWSASEHDAYLNSAALSADNITQDSLKVNGVQAGPDGKPNGVFIGLEALTLAFHIAGPTLLDPQFIQRAMKFMADLNRQGGVTTTADLALGIADINTEVKALTAFFNQPSVPLRLVLVAHAVAFNAQFGTGAVRFAQSLRSQNTDKVIFNGVKFFSDDAFLTLGMQIRPPGYLDGHQGLWITPPDTLLSLMTPWWKAGFDIHIHTNGDASHDVVLDALAALEAASPPAGQRFVMEHIGLVDPDQALRMKNLGALASFNGYYLYYRGIFNVPFLGQARSFASQPQQMLLNAGVKIAAHSDTPIAPPQPLLAMGTAMTRTGVEGEPMNPSSGLTLHQALRMVTIDAAYMIRMEDNVGSIAPGKYADFAVLLEDPYSVTPDHIKDIPVWGTVFAGNKFPAHPLTP